MGATTAVFSIVAKNYLAHARVLMASVAQHHPDWRRFVILVDTVDGRFDPRQENFEIIHSSALPCPNIEWVQFKYTVLELSTALKPYAFDHLFRNHSLDRIIYLDPDIKLYSPLDKAIDALDSCNLVLTPHLTETLKDSKHPSEISILRSGSYNLGFIAVARSTTSDRFLTWWQDKLYEQCVVDLAEGLFVDQRWIDLVPALFEGVHILRDPGYNVAYWNLAHRYVTADGNGYKANDSRLAFFHFSGYDPTRPKDLSKHQNRFATQDLSQAAQTILQSYGQELISSGFLNCQKWPYTFSSFCNGIPIPDLCRPVHHEAPELLRSVSDPFSEEGFRSFVRVWNTPYTADFPGVSKLAYRIYQARGDVRAQMPNIFGQDYRPFLNWMIQSAHSEHNIPEVFLGPFTAALNEIEEQGGIDSYVTAAESLTEQNQFVEAQGSSSSIHWTKLALAIYYSRADLQAAYPQPLGNDGVPFLTWLLTRGRFEHHLSWDQVKLLDEQFHSYVASLPSGTAKMTMRLTLRKRFIFAALYAMGSRITSDTNGARPLPPLSLASRRFDDRSRLPDVPGVNLVGYLHRETGVGQSARGAFSALKATSISSSLVSAAESGSGTRPASAEARHTVNVFCVNADQTTVVKRLLGPSFYQKRLNIGYWNWELEDFPNDWLDSFSTYQEIWAPSSFCYKAFAKKSPIPVVYMPHSVAPPVPQGMGRDHFGIRHDRFVFLTALDVLSIVRRKNPIAVIKAFQLAFNGDPRYELIVKVNNASAARQEVEKLQEACAAALNIRLLDATLIRDEMYALSRCIDCFVSLHRSEGFGLLIAEAMYFEKPVIVTNYSGNTDFTSTDNSFLVEYKMVPVGEGCAPYPSDSLWADASVEHASRRMLDVAKNADLRILRAKAGSETIRRTLSAETIGQKMLDRLRLRQPGFYSEERADAAAASQIPQHPKALHALGTRYV